VLPILEDKNRERQIQDGQKWRKTKQGRGEGRGGEEHAQSFIVRCTFLGIKYYFIVTTLVTRVVNWLPKLIGTFKTCLSINYKLIL
jgi:hypothetical protein